jgi:predicted nucleic acid-binding protein
LTLFFDSSVLVPVFYAGHPHHTISTKVFLAAGKEDFCALRTLGEVYSTLTGLPLRPRITGRDGIAVLRQIRDRLTLVSLTEPEYFTALESVSDTIVGAAAYDSLITHCALRVGADTLLTWNARDFTRLDPKIARRVKTPLNLS